MYSFIAENILYPLGDLALGTSVMKYYHWLQKTQWWSSEQLKELQDQKLRKLIEHAYNNVPYYSNLFKSLGLTSTDIKTTEDLVKLPILTKEDIRGHFEEFKAIDYNKYNPILDATGGSTGIPLQYFITKDVASINWAAMFRSWTWAGYRIGDRRVSFGGSSLVPNKRPSLFICIRQKLERNLSLSAVSMNEAKYNEYVQRIRTYNPKFIYGYASSIFLLADYCKTHNLNEISFKAVFSTAEVLLPNYRSTIENQFKCKVFDQYGSYDGGGQALECDAHNGFHISAEKCILETVSDDGKFVPSGQSGTIIVTDLHNYAMPFIRYKVEDVGILDSRKCKCGRGLPLLQSIEGRTTDIIKLSNGVTVAGPAITLIFKNCHIKQYQLVQTKENELLVKIVKADDFSESDTEHFINTLRHHTGNEIKISLEFCNNIPPESNNKYKFVRSNTVR